LAREFQAQPLTFMAKGDTAVPGGPGVARVCRASGIEVDGREDERPSNTDSHHPGMREDIARHPRGADHGLVDQIVATPSTA
jgi:hypothetical protein